MGSQRVRHDWVTELNWTELNWTRDEQKWNPVHCQWGCKMAQPLWKSKQYFLSKLKIELCNSAIILLTLFPKELKAGFQIYLHSHIHGNIIYNSQKIEANPNVWISKMWHILTMKYYSALIRKEILIHGTKWITCDDIMLSETTPSQKHKYYIIPYTYMKSVLCTLHIS